MWKIIAALLFTFITVSNASDSDSPSIENEEICEEGPKYIGEEEFQYVVSLGVFKNGNYTHICLAVMITGLNGITAATCGHYEYYAGRAGLIECEKNLAEENRTKLHVNTKRPMHFDPDTSYNVIHFIDFDKYLFNGNKGAKYFKRPDIGVFVLNKKVQYTRPVLNIPISEIMELPEGTLFTLIAVSTIKYRPPGGEMLMEKKIEKVNQALHVGSFSSMKPYHFCATSSYKFSYEFSSTRELGAPVYFGDQYVGIFIDFSAHTIARSDGYFDYRWHATVAIDAYLEEHIDKIIASTWIPRINERQTKGKAEASSS